MCALQWFKNTALATALLSVSSLSLAQQTDANVEAFIQEQVEQHQLDEQQVRRWLAQAEKNEQVLEAIQRPWEAKPCCHCSYAHGWCT